MKHINEDILLKYALELIENKEEQADIETHLTNCPECRSRLWEVRAYMEVIGSIRPRPIKLSLPIRKSRQNIFYLMIRAAALIIFGIAIGYGGANLEYSEEVSVTSSYVALSPPADSLIGFAVSDATEISLK